MSKDIEELERRVKDAQQVLRDAREALRLARIEAAPVSVGDVVWSTQSGKRGRVVVVDPISFGTWVKVNQEKKDGTFGNAVHNWYGYFTTEAP